jgi:hypothetical protein
MSESEYFESQADAIRHMGSPPPSTDLVERLRNLAEGTHWSRDTVHCDLLAEAADEIERQQRIYEFDVNIPLQECREEIERLEAEVARLRETNEKLWIGRSGYQNHGEQ